MATIGAGVSSTYVSRVTAGDNPAAGQVTPISTQAPSAVDTVMISVGDLLYIRGSGPATPALTVINKTTGSANFVESETIVGAASNIWQGAKPRDWRAPDPDLGEVEAPA